MRLGALALGAVSVAAFAVGCASNNSGSSAAAPGDTPGGNGANGFQAYISCLSKNGVTIQQPSNRPRPSGSRPAGAFPSGAFPSGASRSGGPGGGFGGGFPGGGGAGAFQKPADVDDATWAKAQAACASVRPSGRAGGADNGAITAYRNCLSNHGVTASAAAGQLNTSDPTVAAAEKACAALRPSAGPTPTG
jgi:hypothetical protein